MIYLIDDDSKNQRVAYGASYINDGLYDDILCHLEKVNPDLDLSLLSGASYVMVHESLADFINGQYDDTSHIAQDNIIHYADKNNIPYVCFSDGHAPIGIFDSNNNIVCLKKSTFYARLQDFLDYYKASHNIEPRILAYGREFQKYIIEKLIKSLFLKFSHKSPTDRLMPADVMPSKANEPEYCKQIINLAQPAIGIGYDDLLDDIEDNDITVGEFKQHVNKIFNSVSQYGTNTYTWE